MYVHVNLSERDVGSETTNLCTFSLLYFALVHTSITIYNLTYICMHLTMYSYILIPCVHKSNGAKGKHFQVSWERIRNLSPGKSCTLLVHTYAFGQTTVNVECLLKAL